MEIYNSKFLIDNSEYYQIEVKLPKTTLLIVGNDVGFIMCGALNVEIYDSLKLIDRKVVCANVLGVKTIDDLMNGYINSSTKEAINKGIIKGMSVREAITRLI